MVLTCDFNEILSNSEKICGRIHSQTTMANCRDFIEEEGLIYLGFIGLIVTWRNKRNREDIILQRNDRDLATST